MTGTTTDRARAARRAPPGPLAALLAFLLLAAPAAAQDRQDELSDVFGTLGTASTADQDAAPPATQKPGEGTLLGQVFDGGTGLPVQGATVIVTWPRPPDGGEPRIEVRVTDIDGAFEYPSLPAGTYTIGFSKAGYRAATMTDFAVEAGQLNRADFPLPPLPSETSDEVLQLDAFVVEASTVEEMMASLELRLDSDKMLNIMSAEDFSKYAASDVADALKRVAGVNVVEGQFAVIRGLEDRYSSTVYNSAPVPSPDPDRQSVQLDLFPSEVVSNLIVSKTFTSELPSNSSGGAIDIVTHDYPPEFDLKLKAAAGFNDRAIDRFLEYENGSPVGKETWGTDTIESEFGAFLGGRKELFDREFRFKGVFNWETDYVTAEGFQEAREPRQCRLNRPGVSCDAARSRDRIIQDGGLADGELFLSRGRFDLTTSEWSQQITGYGGFGFDIDPAANHRIDGSVFYTKKKEEVVQLREDGSFPEFDYSELRDEWASGGDPVPSQLYDNFATISSWLRNGTRQGSQRDIPARGGLWYSSFNESQSFKTKRDLLVTQLNGDHRLDQVPGLHFRWAGNYAKTTQKETALGLRYFYEPDDVPDPLPMGPTKADELGPGRWATSFAPRSNQNDIEEKQWFGRGDLGYERDLAEFLTLKLSTGGWYEHARRDVASTFLQRPTVDGNSQFAVFGDTPLELGKLILPSLDQQDGRPTLTRDITNDSRREIWAWYLGTKTTFWEKWDVVGGFRLENINIQSNNDPFVPDGTLRFPPGPTGAPLTFPDVYIFFDQLDNIDRGEVSLAQARAGLGPFNGDILGIDRARTPCNDLNGDGTPDQACVDFRSQSAIQSIVNGEIDEMKFLPGVSFAYRVLPELTLRAAWSQTVARPSFREMGFYPSVEPASDDLIVGNPQLQLSDVHSWDLRGEWVGGEGTDLFAISAFYKTIKDPIESIVLRNPADFEFSSDSLWRTFFNNPNEATLWGVEIEGRKNLEFLGFPLAEFFSVGSNFTYISAEVDRIEAERGRAQTFFTTAPGSSGLFESLDSTRRLFGQPQWIANADLTFHQPDWGTKLTLAFFGISDVLDAAGSVLIGQNGSILGFVPDRYVDSFTQLDLVMSQEWRNWNFKLSLKNLVDTTRRIVYDPNQTAGRFTERSFKRGRDFKFSVTFTW